MNTFLIAIVAVVCLILGFLIGLGTAALLLSPG